MPQLTETRPDLNVVAAVPWHNEEHATPVRDVMLVCEVAKGRYGIGFAKGRLHPSTLDAVARTKEFGWRRKLLTDPPNPLELTGPDLHLAELKLILSEQVGDVSADEGAEAGKFFLESGAGEVAYTAVVRGS